MEISGEGLALIKRFEGLRLTTYRDAVGILTIGYGSTGPEAYEGHTITQAEADALLAEDVKRFGDGVAAAVTAPLTQAQFDALVSFSFNLGLGALENSHLLFYLNQRHYAMAAAEFPRWNMAGGQVLLGLVKRRVAEASLFLEGTT